MRLRSGAGRARRAEGMVDGGVVVVVVVVVVGRGRWMVAVSADCDALG